MESPEGAEGRQGEAQAIRVVLASTVALDFPGGVQRNIAMLRRGLLDSGARLLEANRPAGPTAGARRSVVRRAWRRLDPTGEELWRIRRSVRALVADLRALPADRPVLAFDAWAAIAARRAGRTLVYRTPAMTWATEEYVKNGYLTSTPAVAALLEEEQLAIRGAAAVVTLSERGRAAFVERGVSPDRIHVVPNSVDVRPDPAPLHERERLRLLWVAHLKPLKGLDVLLDAVAALPGHLRQRVAIEVIGAGADAGNPVYTAACAAIERAGLDVTFRGTMAGDAVRATMREADLFVLSSHPGQEHFSNVVIEAMEAGLPVVATDVGAIPEMLGPEGADAIVPPGDAARLSDALARCVADPALRRVAGHRNRSRAVLLFSVESMVARYCAVLAGLAESQ